VATTNHAFFIYNRNATYDLTVKNAGATVIGTVKISTAELFISDGANGWVRIGPTITAAGVAMIAAANAAAQLALMSGVDLTTAQTLTNKRNTRRCDTSENSHATPTCNTDNYDQKILSAQGEGITNMSTNLSGTPTEGQTFIVSITGTAARAITWGASFEASTVALPTTTVTTARLDVGFIWNTVTSKWRCLAVA
jgi:hypothetical protein